VLNNRRSELEIIHHILSLSNKGVRKTKLLYQVNLNHRQLNTYMEFLIEKNILIEKEVETETGKSYSIYEISTKGLKLIENIDRIFDILE
jgi:predicted transcriptional regulator